MKYFLFVWAAVFALVGCRNETKQPVTPTATDHVLAAMEMDIQQFPDSIMLVDRLIDTLSNRGKFEAAAVWCDTLLKRDSNKHFIYQLVKADLYRSAKSYDKAITAYEKYLQQRPEENLVFLSLANTMAEAGSDRTLKFCDQVWYRFPTPETRTGLCYIKGIYYNTIKNYSEARRWMDSTIRYDYAFVDAYMEKGYAWYDEGNFKEAQSTFSKLTEVSPKYADGWYWLAKSYDTLKMNDKAIEAYQRALLINSQIPEAEAAINRLSSHP
ncbi:MAG TPA: tetratricopeptide repeat protein [Phnomibacter sp.]|nr:tetratricopeptide repeat protein [Phnomibacter sp.]